MEKRNAKKEKNGYEKAAFVETPDRIYLAVRGEEEKYYFAYLDTETDKIILAEELKIDGKRYIPLIPKLDEKGHSLPVEYPTTNIINMEQIETGELFYKIKEHLRKYIDLPENDLELAVFFLLFSWFYRKSNTAAYLRFLGDSGKGKSRMLTVVGDLCFYPLMIAGTATRSAIMRTQEMVKGTLVLDEADFRGDKENDMVKFINAGFERRKIAIMSNRNDPSKIEAYDPFSPKLFAMREPFRDAATEGRILSISPYETTRTDIPPVLPPEYQEETQKLRDTIAAWMLRNWDRVNGEALDLVRQLPVEPRLKQLAAPLSIILPLFGDGTMENAFVKWLLERQKKIAEQRATSAEGMIFNAIVDIAQGIVRGRDLPQKFEKYIDYAYDEEDGKITVITASMLSELTGMSAGKIGRLLQEIGFHIKRRTISIMDSKVRGRYIYLDDTRRWVEGWRKYRINESISEVPDIVKDPEIEYKPVIELLPEPTEIELRILEGEMANGEETVRCMVLDRFSWYSNTLGKDILLKEGMEIKFPRELATQLSKAGKVDVIDDDENVRQSELS